MIAKKDSRELVNHRLKDADILIANRRYASAIYLSGYALELSLKWKICKIFQLKQGFPENKAEFLFYKNSYKSQHLLAGTINQIKEIRHHDLNKLLFYSGVEYQIKLNYLPEWNRAVSWSPEIRYKPQKVSKGEADVMVNAIKTLIQAIL